MSTLNCPEEVYLAEKLVELHPWAEMVRFARSGGEANSIAIRIARAATDRDVVAVCGYHGWHDWYLASNLSDKDSLNDHLLPGLSTAGVPSSLSGTVQPFFYNQFDQLEKIASEHNLAAVKMEVQRSTPPAPGFLQAVRQLCDKKGIVLIFDECSSGFRETFGGLHLKYGVAPDLAMFGKTLGNGYAITSVIGKSSVMQAAQKSFISSTFWTERIGPAAALKALQVMESLRSWEIITQIGASMKSSWHAIASSHSINLVTNGLDALASFSINSQHARHYKTFITQEMLKQGYLAATTFYPSVAHTDDVIQPYIELMDKIFARISECENHGVDINQLLYGNLCHDGFYRLN